MPIAHYSCSIFGKLFESPPCTVEMTTATMQVGSVIRFCANWHSGGLQWQSELDDVEKQGEKLKCKSSFPRLGIFAEARPSATKGAEYGLVQPTLPNG